MGTLPPPLAFVLLLFSGWVNRHQQPVLCENSAEVACPSPYLKALRRQVVVDHHTSVGFRGISRLFQGMSQSKLELPRAHGEVALIPRRRNG
jgi:hypothetical protein